VTTSVSTSDDDAVGPVSGSIEAVWAKAEAHLGELYRLDEVLNQNLRSAIDGIVRATDRDERDATTAAVRLERVNRANADGLSATLAGRPPTADGNGDVLSRRSVLRGAAGLGAAAVAAFGGGFGGTTASELLFSGGDPDVAALKAELEIARRDLAAANAVIAQLTEMNEDLVAALASALATAEAVCDEIEIGFTG